MSNRETIFRLENKALTGDRMSMVKIVSIFRDYRRAFEYIVAEGFDADDVFERLQVQIARDYDLE